jgi:hypothetical protein
MKLCCFTTTLLLVFSSWTAVHAQGTLADYQRAHDLQSKARDLVVNTPGTPKWIGDSHRFWYARTVKEGDEYLLVDADIHTKKPAFDHAKLADAISKATGQHYTAQTLPFQPLPRGRANGGRGMGTSPQTSPLTFLDDDKTIQFGVSGSLYKCDLQAYTCTKTGPIPPAEDGRQRASEGPTTLSPEGPGGDPTDGLAYEPPASQEDDNGRYRRLPHACAPSPSDHQQRELRRGPRQATPLGVGSQFPDQLPPEAHEVCASFAGKWEAFIENYNVFLKPVGNGKEFPLSFDGTDGNYYSLRSFAWSPDSKNLVAYHTRPGYDREIEYIESSPADQLQPKHLRSITQSLATRLIKVGDKNHWQLITPDTTRWQTMSTPLDSEPFEVATDLYYVNIRKL